MQLDESLIMEARKLAGAHIHKVTGDIAGYETSVAGHNRMVKRIEYGDVADWVQEAKAERKQLAEVFETRLRIFVAKQRQLTA